MLFHPIRSVDPDAINADADADDVNRAIAQRLSTFRRLRGMSAAELGEKIGLSAAELRLIEATGRALRPVDMLRASIALDIPIGRLFCEHPAAQFPVSPAVNIDLAQRLGQLPQPALNSLLAVVSALEDIHVNS